MNDTARRRTIIIVVLVIIIILLLLLLTKCMPEKPEAQQRAATNQTPPAVSNDGGRPAADVPAATTPDEVLTPATLEAPAQVIAGAVMHVAWTGPDNLGDFITIVKPETPANEYAYYRETKEGSSLELTAPIEPGAYEVRYVTDRSRTILGRAPVEVIAAGATLDAVDKVILGSTFAVAWTGPNNKGDYITIVPRSAPDDFYASYADAEKGSPQSLLAPTVEGECELRYVTSQAKKVLARRPIRVLAADVTLSSADQAIAGATIQVTWTGPDNAGDYITVVASDTPEGQYGNYTYTNKGSPLELLVPIMAGHAELRYMTGQGNRVLGRRAITIVAAKITLSAPPEGSAGAEVSVTWTGPNSPGDYITIVSKATPDGQFAAYTYTTGGTPLNVTLPKEPGDAEVRYMAGQGNKVLARIPIKVVAAPQ